MRLPRLFAAILVVSSCHAFAPSLKPPFISRLFMAKGLNRARNKQAEMLKKMELAKKQKNNGDENEGEAPSVDQDAQGNEQQEYDRLLFAELLAKSQPVQSERTFTERTFTQSESKATDSSKSNKPKVKAKEAKRAKKKLKASTSQDEQVEEEDAPLNQGDIAKRRHFESLVELSTNQPLGAARAAQLVPWVPPYLTNYLIVVCDPRRQSGDLRQAIQYLTSNLPSEICEQVIVISTDSNEETKSWMNRAVVETPIRIFSDVKLQWMNMYSAVVDDERWSMSVYVIDTDGRIHHHSRQVDPSKASQLVMDIVESIQEE